MTMTCASANPHPQNEKLIDPTIDRRKIMIEAENDCVGCPQGCVHCGRDRTYYVWTCDGCGEKTTEYDEFVQSKDGKCYCPDCCEELFGGAI